MSQTDTTTRIDAARRRLAEAEAAYDKLVEQKKALAEQLMAAGDEVHRRRLEGLALAVELGLVPTPGSPASWDLADSIAMSRASTSQEVVEEVKV